MPDAGDGGVELHYEREGAGESLLLIQGMSGTRLSWGEPFLAPLRERFECVRFDNRGIGLSGQTEEPFAIADLATDTVALLDRLEIESAHVLGISMGGMVAQELALAHPERIRTLTIGCSYCGGPGSKLMDPANVGVLAEAIASADQGRVFRAMWELNLSPAFRAEDSRYPAFAEMAAATPVPRRTVELQMQAILGHDTSARLPGLSVPTQVLHGTVDLVLPYENGPLIASLVPGARLETLEDVGHMFWWERPERSAELLAVFAAGGGV
ncbi:MAG TPA: alpha/beta fold hydrolase [Solirubrobacterales bacterium]|nr:alpha/beta fold hydrolase [Solirubrobacterales bacterium]